MQYIFNVIKEYLAVLLTLLVIATCGTIIGHIFLGYVLVSAILQVCVVVGSATTAICALGLFNYYS